MADKSMESRIGSLEARADEGDSRWGDIKAYMIRNGDTLTEIHKTLASINGNVSDFKEYQERCDADRQSLEKRSDDHETRLRDTENLHSRQIKAAMIGGGIMSFLALGGASMLGKLLTWVGHDG